MQNSGIVFKCTYISKLVGHVIKKCKVQLHLVWNLTPKKVSGSEEVEIIVTKENFADPKCKLTMPTTK